MYFVYILQSIKTGQVYKGLTDNLERRLKQHFNGQSSTTSKIVPLKLVHAEVCLNRSEARKLEKFFKSGYGREVIKQIIEESRGGGMADTRVSKTREL